MTIPTILYVVAGWMLLGIATGIFVWTKTEDFKSQHLPWLIFMAAVGPFCLIGLIEEDTTWFRKRGGRD